MLKEKFKHIYTIVLIATLIICTIGSTYAYWAATATSESEAVKTSSSIYSISMKIIPLYTDFSFIPMNDNDILKGLSNKCRDKYDRGACNAYKIHVYGYNQDLNFISGKMDVNVNNIENLSYTMLEEKTESEYDETKCVKITESQEEPDTTELQEESNITETSEEKIYCQVLPATQVSDGVGLTLGDKYEVANTTEKNLILLMWLTNIEESQNEKNIGTFNSIVTFSMGSGGEIKGSISTVLEENRDILQSEE